MRFGSGIEIELTNPSARNSGRSTLQEIRSAGSWIAAQRLPQAERSDGDPVSIDEFLTETHHQYYGRPWILGRFYFDQLVRRGVKPGDRVLDFGCGCGRVGIWLIPYLQTSRYFGMDAHLRSLVGFAEYEALLHDLLPKVPRLLLDGEFSFGHFGVEFDVMLDFSVTWGLPPDRIKQAYAGAYRHLVPGARVFLAGEPRLSTRELTEIGFSLTHRETVTYPIPLPEKGSTLMRNVDDWHELTRQ